MLTGPANQTFRKSLRNMALLYWSEAQAWASNFIIAVRTVALWEDVSAKETVTSTRRVIIPRSVSSGSSRETLDVIIAVAVVIPRA